LATARERLTLPLSPAADLRGVGDALKLKLGTNRIILASNRGPVQYRRDRRGDLVAQRGQGGLVTALTSLLRHTRVSWVASSMSPADREAARHLERSPKHRLLDDSLRLRLVNVAGNVYRRHYQVFSNPVLWLLQHSLAGELAERPSTMVKEAWRWGYLPVNRALARAVVEELNEPDTVPWVFIHDYHLYLTGLFIRQQVPNAFLQHFTHIPWPEPGEGVRHLGPIWKEILRGLLSNDIVGFQTEDHVLNFLNDCRLSLPEAQVDYSTNSVFQLGRTVGVRAYPISVDVSELRETSESMEFAVYRHQLASLCSEFTIVKVERVDPTKNTILSLEAFRRLLTVHPELVGRATMLAFLVPSRTSIPEYRRFTQRLMDTVDSVNSQFVMPGYLPVRVFYENNYLQALAGMSLYDVLLVNPVADGMNLVAKEGPIVNKKDGVVVLSETAGAYTQLWPGVLSVRPDDIDGTAEALYQGLFMQREERRRRASYLRTSIQREDLTDWLGRQMQDALAVVSQPGGKVRMATLPV